MTRKLPRRAPCDSDAPLFALNDTIRCAEHGCVVCAYKLTLFPEDAAKAEQNQRPEMCLRVLASQAGSAEEEAKANAPRCGLHGRHERTLVVGDGDLSFSLSLALQLGGEGLVATSLETQDSLELIYASAASNAARLAALGATVMYSTDATTLDKDRLLGKEGGDGRRGYDRIVFNFPCLPWEEGYDGQAEHVEANRRLIREFLLCAQSLLVSGGQVQVTHKTVAPFGDWGVAGLAKTEGCDLVYCGAVIFDKSCYPGYTNSKALAAQSFPSFDAVTHCFRIPHHVSAVSEGGTAEGEGEGVAASGGATGGASQIGGDQGQRIDILLPPTSPEYEARIVERCVSGASILAARRAKKRSGKKKAKSKSQLSSALSFAVEAGRTLVMHDRVAHAGGDRWPESCVPIRQSTLDKVAASLVLRDISMLDKKTLRRERKRAREAEVASDDDDDDDDSGHNDGMGHVVRHKVWRGKSKSKR